jgi:dipeptidyl aminopeptidase/acylaminoacyl peptidase
VLLAAVLAVLTPAGATVRHWIGDAIGTPHPRPKLTSLPATGSVLVTGRGGVWTLAANGLRRRLGAYAQASWSPHAKFVATAGKDGLTVLDPHGTVRWTLPQPAVHDPTWFSPSGYRIAYLSGSSLRVVAGDGTGDKLLAASVARVAPAWRTGTPYELAYADSPRSIVVRDADSGVVLWSRPELADVRQLAWSKDGSRLLVLTTTTALVSDASGKVLARVPLSTRAPLVDAAFSPDGLSLAIVRGAAAAHAQNRPMTGDVVLVDLRPPAGSTRRVFSGAELGQVSWSPDGNWLLVSWPAADQWIFVRATGAPYFQGSSRIAEQFRSRSMPRLEGWCCTAVGTAG